MGYIYSNLDVYLYAPFYYSPEQFSEPSLVRWILHHSELDARRVLLPELLVIILAHLLEHVQGLPHQLLLDHLQKFVLLEHFSRHVQRQVIRINLFSEEGGRGREGKRER